MNVLPLHLSSWVRFVIVSIRVGFSVVVGAAAAVAKMEVMVMALKKCILKSGSSQTGKNEL